MLRLKVLPISCELGSPRISLTVLGLTTVAVYEDLLWCIESLVVNDVVELTPSKPIVAMMWVTLREGHFNTRAHGNR